MDQGIKVIAIHFMPNNGNRIKGFADVKIGDWVVREFRILADWDGMKVVPPRVSWRGTDGVIKFKTVVSLPQDIKERVNTLILEKFEEEREIAEKQSTT